MLLLKRIAKIFKLLLIVLATIVLLLLVCELAWRYQWIDFYKKELRVLNLSSHTERSRSVLLFGDSFTADPAGYVSVLRDSFPAYDFINAAVPGTCIKEVNALAPGRIRQFKPELVICQLYLGNDLSDLRHPGPQGVSCLRNFYWQIADRLRFVAWLNYASGQLFHQIGWNTKKESTGGTVNSGTAENPKDNGTFSVETYSAREKILFNAEPALIQNSVMLEGGRAEQFETLLSGLEDLAAECEKADAKLWILVVPHCSQVAPVYYERMQKLGAELPPQNEMRAANFPFYMKLEEKFSGRKGIAQMLNLQPWLSYAEREGKITFLANDPHLTASGQQSVAGFLSPHIREFFRTNP